MEQQITLQPGTLLRGGAYRVERALSSGGFGNTYVVTNLNFDETFAMKEFFMKDINLRDGNAVTVSIADNRSTFDAQREKFMKEAKRLRKLKSEHVVSVYDLFEENGTVYYVMDFIDGESLRTRLERTGQPMTENEVRGILDQVLDALDDIHQQGIWHLDLKPANMMMNREGRVLLIDFGASKQMKAGEGVTTSSGVSYTPGYAPIEQIEQNADKFGPWTDFYALGATLYQLLTLRSLPSPTELMDEGDSALQYPPTVSPQMRQLIFRLMQTSRMHRPQSVADIRALLSAKTPVVEKSAAAPAVPRSEETQVIAPPPVPQPVTPKPAAPKPVAPKPVSPKPAPAYVEPKKSTPVWPFIAVGAVVLVLLLGVGGFFVSRMLKTDNKVAEVDPVSTVEPASTENDLEALAAVTPEPEAADVEPEPETADVEPEPATADVEPVETPVKPEPRTTTPSAPKPKPESSSSDNKVYDLVEQMPSFPGGANAMSSYISRSIRYPKDAEANGIQGRVMVTFVVEKNGSISNVSVARGVDPSLDKEAIRVVKSMPRWVPGKQNGVPARVKFMAVVPFRL